MKGRFLKVFRRSYCLNVGKRANMLGIDNLYMWIINLKVDENCNKQHYRIRMHY